jgi:hypothetical protein
MSLAGHIFHWYVVLSMVLTFCIMLGGFYDDAVHGPCTKFGYNHRSSLFWFIVAGCLPIVNLMAATLILWARFGKRT